MTRKITKEWWTDAVFFYLLYIVVFFLTTKLIFYVPHSCYTLQINYMLNEDRNWAIDVPGLRGILQEARNHCDPRIIVVINPGNPTGKKIKISIAVHVCWLCTIQLYL